MKVELGRYKKVGKRKLVVRIDPWDVWSADYTLSLIILPLLILYRREMHGIPMQMFSKEYHALLDSKKYWKEKELNRKTGRIGPLERRLRKLSDEAFTRWKETIDEMIWAFKQVVGSEPSFWKVKPNHKKGIKGVMDMDAWKAYHDRISAGIRLFGENFQSLWN